MLGSAGTGKSSLLFSLASTRPGHAIVLSRPGAPKLDETPGAITEWLTGEDEPARPHALTVATPGAVLDRESDEGMQKRRREQTIFERRATEGGFSFSAFPGCRWFSRSPIVLTSPERALGSLRCSSHTVIRRRHAQRSHARDQQILSGAALGAAVAAKMGQDDRIHAPRRRAARGGDRARRPSRLMPMSGSMRRLSSPSSRARAGAPLPSTSCRRAPGTLRHSPRCRCGRSTPLTRRAIRSPTKEWWSSTMSSCTKMQRRSDRLAPALRRALPRVQWVVTTSSPNVALGCEPHEIIALRRLEASGAVELHTGSMALVH